MFRHTAGVRLAKAGRNAFAIQKRLGHVSVLSTQVYVDLAGPDRRDEDRKDDEAMEGGSCDL
jgi:integrase